MLRSAMILLALLLPLSGVGCGLLHTGTTVLTHMTHEALQEHAEKKRNRAWARQAWELVAQANPAQTFPPDYAQGFREGFAEYLYRGGNGEPPAIPPFRYRALRYQTPDGYQSVLAWFAGYRHGAAAARQGGYRELITGPSSLQAAAVPMALPAPAEQVQTQKPVDSPPLQPTGWRFIVNIKAPWDR